MPEDSAAFRRRLLLTAGGAVLAGALTSSTPAVRQPWTPSGGQNGLFSLGIASGDPLPDAVVLWTRLAPDPLHNGGMPNSPVAVEWEIAEDERFIRGRRQGVTTAYPVYGHSVHVDVKGLEPEREYFYRFKAGGEPSPVGRTKTAPAFEAMPAKFRFAFASCQNLQDGFFTPYQHLQNEDLDMLLFLGDYIYESAPRDNAVRYHEGNGEPYTLEQYRNRYAQYKTDPYLQAVHARFPWVVALDDHEIDNNWASLSPQDPAKQSLAQFARRRAAALQAFWEHMPLRPETLQNDKSLQMYRRIQFGRLATLHMLDTRQYRSNQPTNITEAGSNDLTMLGSAQKQWLAQGLANSSTVWNLLGNQIMVASNDRRLGAEKQYDFDNWDGYWAERAELLRMLSRYPNTVVLTGDRHATWVSDLLIDFNDPFSLVAAAEITGTSISSGGDSNPRFQRRFAPLVAENPWWRYFNDHRGYITCEVTPDGLAAKEVAVSTVLRPTGTTASVSAEFFVEAGRPGITVTSRQPKSRVTAPPTPTPSSSSGQPRVTK